MTPVLPAMAVLSLATSCVAPPPPPRVAANPARAIAMPPPAAPAQSPSLLLTDWRDWPQTPGDWRYERTSFGSQASFGSGGERTFTLECGNDRRVHLERPGTSGGALTVRTSSATRVLAVARLGGPPVGVQAALAVGDPLLDAMGFSRGRFVVEQPGAVPLVLPAWAEVERVVGDCRGDGRETLP